MSTQSSRGTQWQALRLQVLNRDNHQCQYCGREATTVDHVLPKAKGGKDELSNLVAACSECNSQKQDALLVRMNYVNTKWLPSL